MSEVIENRIERLRLELEQAEAEQRRQVEAAAEDRARQADRDAARAALAAEVRALVETYNAAEAEQAERRRRLFGALATITGGRLVAFASGAVWSNAWPSDPAALDLQAARALGAVDQRITRLEAGELGM